MKATLNSLSLKKGGKVYLYGNWNGNEKPTIDFYIQEYTVHSIGKVRCYLLINNDINSKRSYSCTNELNVDITPENAMASCKAYVPLYVTRETATYESRITESIRYHNNNQSAYKGGQEHYLSMIQGMSVNLNGAPKRILINPYSSDTPEIINLNG